MKKPNFIPEKKQYLRCFTGPKYAKEVGVSKETNNISHNALFMLKVAKLLSFQLTFHVSDQIFNEKIKSFLFCFNFTKIFEVETYIWTTPRQVNHQRDQAVFLGIISDL